MSDIAEINQRIVDQGLKDDEKFWVDQSNDGKWKIVNNRFVFKQHDTVSSTTDSGDVSFGQVLSANKNNTILLEDNLMKVMDKFMCSVEELKVLH